MNAKIHGVPLASAWRRCTSCGRIFAVRARDRAPRQCEACGSALLVPARPTLSFLRLLDA